MWHTAANNRRSSSVQIILALYMNFFCPARAICVECFPPCNNRLHSAMTSPANRNKCLFCLPVARDIPIMAHRRRLRGIRGENISESLSASRQITSETVDRFWFTGTSDLESRFPAILCASNCAWTTRREDSVTWSISQSFETNLNASGLWLLPVAREIIFQSNFAIESSKMQQKFDTERKREFPPLRYRNSYILQKF